VSQYVEMTCDVCSMTLGGGTAYAGATSVSGAGDDVDTKYRYRMDHRKRGRFVIINNKTFHQRTGMNERKGTDVDAANLHADFRQLGFDVERHQDQTAGQMLQLMVKGNHYVHLTSGISRVCV